MKPPKNNPTDVYLKARELVGTPYQHQGRLKDIGIDCAGVPIWVAQQLNLGGFDTFDYPKIPDGRILLAVEFICEKYILVPGSLVVFKINLMPAHCGIVSRYMGGLGLIHAWDIAHMVVEHRLTNYWQSRICGCYKLPKINYE